MPQIIVDTATESPASLSLISRLLQDYAVMKAKEEQQAATEYPDADAPIAHASSDMRGPVPPLVEIPVSPSNAEGTAAHAALEADPAVLFGANKPTATVLPFSVPTAPIAAAPVTGTAATVPVAPPVAVASAAASAEVDKAGVPWDARIHSSAKGVKRDGTWKLMRGVDKSLVTMVLHEITPKSHVVAGVIVPAGTVTPVTAAQPVAPPAIPMAPAVPVAPAIHTAAGTVPAGPVATPALNPVQQFQAFMQLVQAGQAAQTLTHVQVSEAVAAEGLPQVQLLITRPDLIPAVKVRLGLL